MSFWQKIALELRFENVDSPLCGGRPRADELVRPWLEARQASEPAYRRLKESDAQPRTLDEIEAERLAMSPQAVDEEVEARWIGFDVGHRNGHCLVVRGGNVRAHLKDAAKFAGKELKKGDVDGFSPILQFCAKLTDRLYVTEDWVRLLRPDGSPILQPDGYRDVTVAAMTAQGPRRCLRRVDYVVPVVLSCTLTFRPGDKVDRNHIKLLLDIGHVRGFGQDRSLQYGRYQWRLGEMEDVEETGEVM